VHALKMSRKTVKKTVKKTVEENVKKMSIGYELVIKVSVY
jgi:hypothetical protein